MDSDIHDNNNASSIGPTYTHCTDVCARNSGWKAPHCIWCKKCAYADTDDYVIQEYLSDCKSTCDTANGYCLQNQYDAGKFAWICAECLDSRKPSQSASASVTKDISDAPQWFKQFESGLQGQMKLINDKIDQEIKSVKECIPMNFDASPHEDTSPHEYHSPPRKLRKGLAQTWANVVGDFSSTANHENNTDKSTKQPAKCTNKFKLKVMADQQSDRNAILKYVNKEITDFPNYISRSHSNSLELLVDSYAMAAKAKETLIKKFEQIEVSKPIQTDAKLYNIVGVPYEVSKTDAVNSLIHDNPNLNLVRCPDDENSVFSNIDPKAMLTVKKIVKCHFRSSYRIVASISSSLMGILKWRNNSSINVEHHVCKLYEITMHDNCFKCLTAGHLASSCTNPAVCSRCAGPHLTKDCDSNIKKCIACARKGLPNDNHYFYRCNVGTND